MTFGTHLYGTLRGQRPREPPTSLGLRIKKKVGAHGQTLCTKTKLGVHGGGAPVKIEIKFFYYESIILQQQEW